MLSCDSTWKYWSTFSSFESFQLFRNQKNSKESYIVHRSSLRPEFGLLALYVNVHVFFYMWMFLFMYQEKETCNLWLLQYLNSVDRPERSEMLRSGFTPVLIMEKLRLRNLSHSLLCVSLFFNILISVYKGLGNCKKIIIF